MREHVGGSRSVAVVIVSPAWTCVGGCGRRGRLTAALRDQPKDLLIPQLRSGSWADAIGRRLHQRSDISVPAERNDDDGRIRRGGESGPQDRQRIGKCGAARVRNKPQSDSSLRRVIISLAAAEIYAFISANRNLRQRVAGIGNHRTDEAGRLIERIRCGIALILRYPICCARNAMPSAIASSRSVPTSVSIMTGVGVAGGGGNACADKDATPRSKNTTALFITITLTFP